MHDGIKAGIILTVFSAIILSILWVFGIFDPIETIKGPTAVAIPNGIRYDIIGNTNQTYTVKQINSNYDFSHRNILVKFKDESGIERTVETNTLMFDVGDTVKYQTVIYSKTCDSGVDLKFSDGYRGISFDIHPTNFTLNDIDPFIQDNYTIEFKFDQCYNKTAQKVFHIIERDGLAGSKIQTDSINFKMY